MEDKEYTKLSIQSLINTNDKKLSALTMEGYYITCEEQNHINDLQQINNELKQILEAL